MKKFLIVIVFYGHLYALDTQSTLKIYHNILSSLIKKHAIRVYTLDKELQKVFLSSDKLILSKDIGQADVFIPTTENEYVRLKKIWSSANSKQKPLIFATDYHILKDHADVIGALYWRKGRSQLLFIRPRVKQLGITLPQKYIPYSIERL
jgi:hypothetical protein